MANVKNAQYKTKNKNKKKTITHWIVNFEEYNSVHFIFPVNLYALSSSATDTKYMKLYKVSNNRIKECD